MNNERNQSVKAMKRGFTLIEMLVVIAIIGMLATLTLKNVMGSLRESQLTTAAAQCQSLEEACVTYQMKHKKFPQNLDQLCEGSRDERILKNKQAIYDPWDNKFEMKKEGKSIIIRSAGPDGSFDTDDDITSDDDKKSKND